MDHNETGCETPQAPALCANNCGFFGSSTTMNFCSKCYRDIVLKQEQEKLTTSSSRITNVNSTSTLVTDAQAPALETVVAAPSASPAAEKNEEAKQGPKRCGTCKKRVGLTGFTCRCGSTLCSTHRYSDKHDCTFDYRAAGREALAKANPVVKADKLEKI